MRPQRKVPGPGQLSVWDFPRPPALVQWHEHVVVTFAGHVVAETTEAWSVLETSHPPTFYLPPGDGEVAAGARAPRPHDGGLAGADLAGQLHEAAVLPGTVQQMAERLLMSRRQVQVGGIRGDGERHLPELEVLGVHDRVGKERAASITTQAAAAAREEASIDAGGSVGAAALGAASRACRSGWSPSRAVNSIGPTRCAATNGTTPCTPAWPGSSALRWTRSSAPGPTSAGPGGRTSAR